MRASRRRALSLLGLSLILSVTYAHAQWGRGREGRIAPRFAPEVFPDRSFSFCRLMYESVRSEPMGMGWRTDYPYAEINLMIRMSELTKADISFDGARQPNHYVVQATDPALFQCPFVMASDAGTAGFTTEEATALRTYLLKGGFLWLDDFWGSFAWEHWQNEIAKVLPPGEFPIVDIPATDPIFRSLFTVARVPQITNIQFWRGVGGTTTSERGSDSEVATLRAIRDSHGRIMVLMSHNTDIADAWEREGEDPGFFYQFSPDGYAIGINILLHALTH
jgi:hypothetical protein